jgi:hypothetical protein
VNCFLRYRVKISGEEIAVLTDVSRDFPQSLLRPTLKKIITALFPILPSSQYIMLCLLPPKLFVGFY